MNKLLSYLRPAIVSSLLLISANWLHAGAQFTGATAAATSTNTACGGGDCLDTTNSTQTKTGGLTSSGTITAIKFIGDGSGLTNLPAAPGGSVLNIRSNNDQNSGNISSMTVIVSNGLGMTVSPSSITLRIPTSAQMTIDTMKATSGTFSNFTSSDVALFASTIVVRGATVTIAGQNYVFPSTAPTAGQSMQVTGVSGGFINLIFGADQVGAGSASTFTAVYVQDEGSAIGGASSATCVGAGITCTQAGGLWTLTVNGGAAQGSAGDSIASSTIAVVNGDSDGDGVGGIDFRVAGTTKAGVTPAGNFYVGLASNTALLAVSTGPGTPLLPLMAISTGSTRVMEVTAASTTINNSSQTWVMADSLLVGTTVSYIRYGAQIGNGNDSSGELATNVGLFVNRQVPTLVMIRDSADNTELKVGAGSSSGIIGTFSSHLLSLITGNTEKMQIASGGNVGIGTTASSKLELFAGSMTIRGTGAGLALHTGNAGIGTSAPTSMVHISSPVGGSSRLMEVSTGTTRLFELTSASMTVSVPTYFKERMDGGGYALDNSSSISINGGGASVIQTTNTNLAFRVTDGTDDDFQVNETSQTNVAVDWTDSKNVMTSTFSVDWTHPMIFTSVAVVNSTSSNAGYGQAIFTHNDSTDVNKVRYYVECPTFDGGFTPLLYMHVHSTGSSFGSNQYVISVATVDAAGGDVVTATMTTPIVSSFTVATVGAGMANSGSVSLTGWDTYLGTGGGSKILVIQVARNGNHINDNSDNPSETAPLRIIFRRKQ